MTSSEPQVMQCMEVWGGNRVVDSGVIMPGLDVWVYSRPYGGSSEGGDVHYVSSCATGRITRLLVADVSGHGEAVSKTAGDLRSLMRRFVNYLDQTRFVAEMNDQFATRTNLGQFATAVVSTFFGPTRDLTICNAGHPPPLLYRAKTGEWSLLEPGVAGFRDRRKKPGVDTGEGATPAAKEARATPAGANIPLGILDQTRYDQFGLRLDVGDLVLCYTDSLIESRDASGEMLGPEGLLRIANSLDVSTPAAVVPALLEAIGRLRAGNLAEDDLTVLLFRANGLGERVSFTKRALAPFRVLGAAVRSLLPGGQPAPWPEMSVPNIGGAMVNALSRRWARRNRDAGSR